MDTIAQPPSASASAAKPVGSAEAGDTKNSQLHGLTSAEARSELEKFGPNAMPDTALHPLRMALEKFWAPVPWMLEAAIVLEIVLGKYVEAAIIAGLLVFNAALGLFQEEPGSTPALRLKSRLRAERVARRDGGGVEKPCRQPIWCRAIW